MDRLYFESYASAADEEGGTQSGAWHVRVKPKDKRGEPQWTEVGTEVATLLERIGAGEFDDQPESELPSGAAVRAAKLSRDPYASVGASMQWPSVRCWG